MDAPVNVIVAGGRDFTDKVLGFRVLDEALGNQSNVTIISGGARGADTIGEQYAHERNIPLIKMNAEWDKYGRSAGYIRNKDMAEKANGLVAFWDGKSNGTRHMINTMHNKAMTQRLTLMCTYIYKNE